MFTAGITLEFIFALKFILSDALSPKTIVGPLNVVVPVIVKFPVISKLFETVSVVPEADIVLEPRFIDETKNKSVNFFVVEPKLYVF